MEINELRIGNIIYVFGECKVVAINADKKKIKVRNEWHTLTEWVPIDSFDVNPIPLTQERLMQFGFYKKKCIGFEWKEEFVKAFDKYGWEIGVLLSTELPPTNPNIGCVSILQSEDEPVSAVPSDLYNKEFWTEDDCRKTENYTEILKAWRQPIAYNVYTVHHLQNIIYNLTGQELTLKQE